MGNNRLIKSDILECKKLHVITLNYKTTPSLQFYFRSQVPNDNLEWNFFYMLSLSGLVTEDMWLKVFQSNFFNSMLYLNENLFQIWKI